LSKESRWIPLIAVVLLVCLGAVCVLGVVGGSTYLGQLTGTEEAVSVDSGARSGEPDESDAVPRAQTPEPVEAPEEEPDISTPSPTGDQVLVGPRAAKAATTIPFTPFTCAKMLVFTMASRYALRTSSGPLNAPVISAPARLLPIPIWATSSAVGINCAATPTKWRACR
jgi:hypothetical protein